MTKWGISISRHFRSVQKNAIPFELPFLCSIDNTIKKMYSFKHLRKMFMNPVCLYLLWLKSIESYCNEVDRYVIGVYHINFGIQVCSIFGSWAGPLKRTPLHSKCHFYILLTPLFFKNVLYFFTNVVKACVNYFSFKKKKYEWWSVLHFLFRNNQNSQI